MGLLSQWRKKNDRYRKQSSPRTAAYLPGNIEKSHFVYKPKLSAREDYLFRPSIQQLAQTHAGENLKKEKPTGLPLSSYYLDFPQISIKPRPDSPKQRPDSPEPRTGSLVLGTGSPEATNIKIIHVKPALDLWKNDESTGLKDDDELDLEKLVPSEVIIGPKGTKLINVKPVKDSMYLVQETDAEPDSQLTTDLSQVVDCDSGEVLEENINKTSGCRLLDNNNRTNNIVSSGIATITLQESSLKPHPDTMFYVTRDEAWRGQSTSITDIKSSNTKKAKKDKVAYTNIETLVEPKDEDEEIKQKKKSKSIFKRFYSRFAQHFR